MRNKAARRARMVAKWKEEGATNEDIKNRFRIKRLIRSGKLPRFNFVKAPDGSLPYVKANNKKGRKLVFTLVGTYDLLTKK